METTLRKRLEIMIEARMQRHVTSILDAHGVSGWTVLPAIAGRGRSGEWSSDGSVSAADGAVLISCVTSPERLDGLLEDVFAVVKRQIGLVTVVDVGVVRPERFD